MLSRTLNMKNRLLIILIAIAFVGCETKKEACEYMLNDLDRGSILDTLNNEFEIFEGSNEYVKALKEYNGIVYKTIQVDKELGDDDTLSVMIDSSQISLSYSHFPYSFIDFVPFLIYKNDSAIIKCKTIKYVSLDCNYNGEVEITKIIKSSCAYVSWELKFSKEILKGKELYFQPEIDRMYKIPKDTIGHLIEIMPL